MYTNSKCTHLCVRYKGPSDWTFYSQWETENTNCKTVTEQHFSRVWCTKKQRSTKFWFLSTINKSAANCHKSERSFWYKPTRKKLLLSMNAREELECPQIRGRKRPRVKGVKRCSGLEAVSIVSDGLPSGVWSVEVAGCLLPRQTQPDKNSPGENLRIAHQLIIFRFISKSTNFLHPYHGVRLLEPFFLSLRSKWRQTTTIQERNQRLGQKQWLCKVRITSVQDRDRSHRFWICLKKGKTNV